uniref:Uncharacterized protein n=1 Tax=Sphaerodactylus townsendi TaxID=933632 RepID=A0ACB8FLI2_9SAUR
MGQGDGMEAPQHLGEGHEEVSNSLRPRKHLDSDFRKHLETNWGPKYTTLSIFPGGGGETQGHRTLILSFRSLSVKSGLPYRVAVRTTEITWMMELKSQYRKSKYFYHTHTHTHTALESCPAEIPPLPKPGPQISRDFLTRSWQPYLQLVQTSLSRATSEEQLSGLPACE